MTPKCNILSLVLCIAMLLLILTSCGSVNETALDSSTATNRVTVEDDAMLGFETVYRIAESATVGVNEYDIDEESGVWVYYLREKLTDVMYVWRTTAREYNTGGYSYWSSGMTVLMDPATNGPMTYEAFQQYIQEVNNG